METTSETKRYGLDEKLVGVTRIKKCKTKLDETMSKEESIQTSIAIDMRDLTIGELIDKYAIAKMVIECQKIWRTSGSVPDSFKYVPSPETTRVTGTISDKQIDKLDDDGTEALIKRLQARQVELRK